MASPTKLSKAEKNVNKLFAKALDEPSVTTVFAWCEARDALMRTEDGIPLIEQPATMLMEQGEYGEAVKIPLRNARHIRTIARLKDFIEDGSQENLRAVLTLFCSQYPHLNPAFAKRYAEAKERYDIYRRSQLFN